MVQFKQAAFKFVESFKEKSARLGPAATLFFEILRLSILLHAPPGTVPAPAGESAMVDGSSSSTATAAEDPRATVKAALAEKKVEVDALSGLMDT